MKRWTSFVTIVILTAVSWACAPATSEQPAAAAKSAETPAASAGNEDVEAVITGLEREWAEAIVKKDTAALERLLAPEFNGTSPTAHTYNKTFAIEDLKSGRYVVTSMDLDEISVNAYGTTAVSFTSQEEKSKYGATDTSGHYHFTDVWIKKDGRWQVVASHGSRYGDTHIKGGKK